MVGSIAAVVGVLLQHDALAGCVGGDVVGPGGGDRPYAFRVDRGVAGDGAEERRRETGWEAARVIGEADRQLVPVDADAGDVFCFAGLVGLFADDVGQEIGAGLRLTSSSG